MHDNGIINLETADTTKSCLHKRLSCAKHTSFTGFSCPASIAAARLVSIMVLTLTLGTVVICTDGHEVVPVAGPRANSCEQTEVEKFVTQ